MLDLTADTKNYIFTKNVKNLVLRSDKLRSLEHLMALLLRVYNSMIRISKRIFNINWEEKLYCLHCVLNNSIYQLPNLSILIFSQEGKK